jgi:hypothetical protein
MAYFNHAFRKAFLATGNGFSGNVTLLDGSTTAAAASGPVLTTANLPTYTLNDISTQVEAFVGATASGYIGFFDPNTNVSLAPGSLADSCCNVYIAGSAIYSNDKNGPFHGGYTETNKSKMINPKYVSRLYAQQACEGSNEVVHVGSTYYTAGSGLILANLSITTAGDTYADGVYAVAVTGGSGAGAVVLVTVTGGVPAFSAVINPGKGYLDTDTGLGIDLATTGTAVVFDSGDVTEAAGDASCCKEFLCDETYNLRVDLKGSPALRMLDHNSYYTADYYTGCCADDSVAPTPVDSTEVMIGWANLLLNSPLVNPFIRIVIQDETGVLWYAPGTSAADLASLGGDTWDNYVSPGHTTGACAGMVISGAYVDTKFGDCTFQPSDFYEKEPVKIYTSEVDLNGDPCEFEGLCVVKECEALQAMGLGETVLRDTIMSESYRQNFLSTDLRIREVTQGNQIVESIDRTGLYDIIYLQHNIPRSYNPTGTFDNDQYLLEFILPTGGALASTYAFFYNWLNGCAVCELEADPYECISACNTPLQFPPLPARRTPLKK